MARLAYQGQGIGKEMRTAILHFAFEALGALEAHSGDSSTMSHHLESRARSATRSAAEGPFFDEAFRPNYSKCDSISHNGIRRHTRRSRFRGLTIVGISLSPQIRQSVSSPSLLDTGNGLGVVACGACMNVTPEDYREMAYNTSPTLRGGMWRTSECSAH